METPSRELLLPNGARTRLPENLFLVGTMNLDEATHPLSRKTLDRANAFVFSEADFTAQEETPWRGERLSPEVAQVLFLTRRVHHVAEARERLKALGFAPMVLATLSEANGILQPHGLGFAYRLRDEALRFCANSFDTDGTGLFDANPSENLRIALDLQLCQKVAPRFSGSQAQLEAPLKKLCEWANSHNFATTARRLERLHTCLQRDGFLHFDIA
jgi:5-methylcytosine-specific restriction endonuclease McrBC GTP-binding regulatory subunit McrB